jgi:hypothetical protein
LLANDGPASTRRTVARRSSAEPTSATAFVTFPLRPPPRVAARCFPPSRWEDHGGLPATISSTCGAVAAVWINRSLRCAIAVRERTAVASASAHLARQGTMPGGQDDLHALVRQREMQVRRTTIESSAWALDE